MPTEEQIDDVMRMLFDVRSQAREPISDERWEQRKKTFVSTTRMLRDDAIRMIEEEEDD